MHVPDGFFDVPTSVAAGAVAVVGVGVALRKARTELDDRTAPMAGLVAAFVFAAQMVNFPVGAGTSGHLMGGALAAILIGPWAGVLCLSVVLFVQALFMADGGITALGINITLLGLVGALVGYAVFVGIMALARQRRGAVAPAAALAAGLSVPIAAVVFTLMFAVGGNVSVEVADVLRVMLTWHVLIGIGEALITGFTVAAVMQTRPDLVHGARRVLAAERSRSTQEVPA